MRRRNSLSAVNGKTQRASARVVFQFNAPTGVRRAELTHAMRTLKADAKDGDKRGEEIRERAERKAKLGAVS